jgi:hypothetical protein
MAYTGPGQVEGGFLVRGNGTGTGRQVGQSCTRMGDGRRIDRAERAEPDADPPFEAVAPGKRANAGLKDRPVRFRFNRGVH